MLFKIIDEENNKKGLEPLPFYNMADIQKLEKDLENIFADHLMDILFEEEPLMTIFQERAIQAEADLYALNKYGDLVLFEFKRECVNKGAISQIFRYIQEAGQWSFGKLEEKYNTYQKKLNPQLTPNLQEDHKDNFLLEKKLSPNQFNTKQHLIIIGNAADDELIDAVDYWKRQGLSIQFMPYRVFKIEKNEYFEFCSLPYDRHRNLKENKGILFDTNSSWDPNAVWEMMEKSRVAAYGDIKYVIDYIKPKDIIFFSHKGVGIIAAGKVVGKIKEDKSLSGLYSERYYDVEPLTSFPQKANGIQKFMPFSEVSKITGKNFYWARTIKVPYLSYEEAKKLLEELKKYL